MARENTAKNIKIFKMRKFLFELNMSEMLT
jgi:hypothetical protein